MSESDSILRGLIWVLNPDAELELESAGPYQPSKKTLATMGQRAPLFSSLVGSHRHFFLGELAAQSFVPGSRALFWCPTPRALEGARHAGLVVGKAPDLAILRRVVDKAFLRSTACRLVPGHQLVSDRTTLARILARGPEASVPGARGWRLKRRYGFAGRGQLRLCSPPSHNDERWLRESFARKGLLVEPQIEGAETLSIHGLLTSRELLVGRPCTFESDPFRVHSMSFARLRNPSPALVNELTTQLELAAEALHGVGYFGPLGMDFLLAAGHTYCIDLNPRFTLAWRLGMGKRASDALAQLVKQSSG